MTTFDERKNAFEKKFAHDEDSLQGDGPPQQAVRPLGRRTLWAKPARRPNLCQDRR